MLDELELLFSHVDNPEATKQDYLDAIIIDNCLGKQSGKTRELTARHLTELYGLDGSLWVFKVFRFFWDKDPQGHALLAALCAYARDPLFRCTVPYILSCSQGATVGREMLEVFLDNKEPGRFSNATLKSLAQNINSTWTKTGHFSGRNKKIRVEAKPTVASAAYAIIIAIMLGHRGRALFDSEPVRMLDCSAGRTMELAQLASEKGWLVFKRIGEIVEVQIPDPFGFLKDGGIA
jgi:hypothetical protein